jgi:hypothetical protein
MSVHDHHNDPNDPVNHPGKRSRSVDPARNPLDPMSQRDRPQGMGPGAWVIGLVLLLALIGGAIYSMSDRTTTATTTGTPPAATTGTTGSGTSSNPSTAPATTGTQTTPPASPAPAR